MIAVLPPFQCQVRSIDYVARVAQGHFNDLLTLEDLLQTAFRERPGYDTTLPPSLVDHFLDLLARTFLSIPELRRISPDTDIDLMQQMVISSWPSLLSKFLLVWPTNERLLQLLGQPTPQLLKIERFQQLFFSFCKLRHAVWLLDPYVCWKVSQPSIVLLGQVRDFMTKRSYLTIDMLEIRHWITRLIVTATKPRNPRLLSFWAAMESFLLALDLEFLLDTRIKFEQTLNRVHWTFTRSTAGVYKMHDQNEAGWLFENRMYVLPRLWIRKALQPPHTWLWLQDESGIPIVRTRSQAYIEQQEQKKQQQEVAAGE